MKTVSIPEKVHKELMTLRLNYGYKNTAQLIEDLVRAYRKERLIKSSELFIKGLRRSTISFSELLHRSKKIREEIVDEWF